MSEHAGHCAVPPARPTAGRGRRVHLVLALVASLLAVRPAGAAGLGRGGGEPPVLPMLFSGATALESRQGQPGQGNYARADSTTRTGDAAMRVRRVQRPGWRRRLLASATISLAGAVAASWCKDRADEAHERYLHAAGPNRRESALDRTERYDRLTGAGFVVMEAGLAACVYLVFF